MLILTIRHNNIRKLWRWLKMSNKEKCKSDKKSKQDLKAKEEREEIKENYKIGIKYYKDIEETHN